MQPFALLQVVLLVTHQTLVSSILELSSSIKQGLSVVNNNHYYVKGQFHSSESPPMKAGSSALMSCMSQFWLVRIHTPYY